MRIAQMGCFAAVLAIPAAVMAQVTVYLDRDAFMADLPPTYGFQDFEGATSDQRQYTGFDLHAGFGTDDQYVGTTDVGFRSRVAVQLLADDMMRVHFAQPVGMLGFQIGCIDSADPTVPRSVRISLRDRADYLIDTFEISTNGREMTTFVGFQAPREVWRLWVEDGWGDSAFTAIDDLVYAAPTPGTAAGFCVVGASVAVRRRRRA